MNAKTKMANCEVLECDAASADYVKQSTPMDLKKKEFADNALTNPDENPARAREVNRRRIQDKVKPI